MTNKTTHEIPTGITLDAADEQPKHLPATAAAPLGAEFQSAFDTKRFAKGLEQRKDNRDTLLSWIKDNLVYGIDFGRIHTVKKDQCPQYKQTRTCDNAYHWSKPSLWKPGAEKINGMMGWVPAYPNLNDYTRMVRAGRTISDLLIQCVIYSSNGRVLGEGIGARSLSQDMVGQGEYKRHDLNKSIKMAKKSALIDATISSAGLSEMFTQDYGDTGDDDDDDTGRKPADQYSPGIEHGADPMATATRIDVRTHCPIGKHKGEAWAQIDAGYLDWVVGNLNKPDIVAAAQAEIKRRQDTPPPQQSESATTAVGTIANVAGTSTLATATRAIALAKTIKDADDAWEAAGNFKPALKKAHDNRVRELQQRALDDQQK
jgi:hypothetical protein